MQNFRYQCRGMVSRKLGKVEYEPCNGESEGAYKSISHFPCDVSLSKFSVVSVTMYLAWTEEAMNNASRKHRRDLWEETMLPPGVQ